MNVIKQSQQPPELTLGGSEPPRRLDWGRARQFSLGLVTEGRPQGVLAAIEPAGAGAAVRIYADGPEAAGEARLVAEVRTDAREAPIALAIPLARIGDGAHAILLQYAGYAARLYVDGVLADEDWPMGTVDFDGAFVRAGVGAGLSLWREAVAPEPAGEALAVRYLGAEPDTLQYWRPQGFNTGVGDCMPFFDGETFRLYYLYDRRGHGSKWGLGAHQWGQVSTKDFRAWTHHPIAVGITGEDEGSICTGSVFRKDGTYYAFYAVRAVDGSPARLTYAVSADGVRFGKSDARIALPDRYTLASVRDPHVFEDGGGRYHMLVTTSLAGDGRPEGCLAHLVSDNLTDWEETAPFLMPGYHDEPECSDCFEWNGWHYLIFSNDGLARYRYARSLEGPWLRPEADAFDCVQWRVPKTAPFPGGRRIAAGFLSSPDRYAGELVFRELTQREDGTLGFAFVPELREAAGEPLDFGDNVLTNPNGFVSRDLGAVPEEYVLTFDVTARHLPMYAGFSVSGAADFAEGFDVRIEPSARKAGVHRIRARSLQEDEASSIYAVDGLAGTFAVEAVVKRGWIDLCIGGDRTLIARTGGGTGHLRLFAQFGEAAFSGVAVRPLGSAHR
ncbi:glycosyl hydrolase [Paenibacillus sp. MWE-103]|uniref:beta-fructofuranosidase n=1 Tax=Paenibacillus artemisiicola TaxID=1172618 RepID=A0ABS3WFS4_9BACL|nr:glycosyl hydrolase [Paenibacillus artemisiicola]MBO7747181.1 glycosyl hydrolase [Paenibacillus artemisiicola]